MATTSATVETDMPGRLITADLLVMPGGKERSWGDYGLHPFFAPGYRDQHFK